MTSSSPAYQDPLSNPFFGRECAYVVTHPPRSEGRGRTRIEGELRTPDGRRHTTFFEFSHPEGAEPARRARPFLLAFLLPAMRIGVPLVLDTPVDRAELENLLEWQGAWARWRPRRLRVVPILAPEKPAEPVPALAPDVSGRGAITAFSGGVDSCFSAWRHTRPEAPERSERRIRLGAGLTVHGFDVPLDQPETFDRVWERSKHLLSTFGLEAFWLRTDVRRLEGAFGCAWETEAHGLWLAAALACLEPWYEGTVIPSTYPYARLRLPWGSNPIGDPLLGSEDRPCRHDGATHTKLDKIRAMAADPAVAQGVRVCWEGTQLDRNCGGCFKCITTQVCFWLSGVARPAAFPARCGLGDVALLPVKNMQNDHLVAQIEAEARAQDRRSLARALRTARTRARFRRVGSSWHRRAKGWAKTWRSQKERST